MRTILGLVVLSSAGCIGSWDWVPDAGNVPQSHGGVASRDAGRTTPDAGERGSDAGLPAPDAGQMDDAGTTPCPLPASGPGDPLPIDSGCPLVLDADHWLRVTVYKLYPWKLDTNDDYCGPVDQTPPPGWDGPCGTKCCKLGVEGGTYGLACEAAMMGTPVWSATCDVTLIPVSNSFQQKFLGAGTIQVCSQYYPQYCSQIAVP